MIMSKFLWSEMTKIVILWRNQKYNQSIIRGFYVSNQRLGHSQKQTLSH